MLVSKSCESSLQKDEYNLKWTYNQQYWLYNISKHKEVQIMQKYICDVCGWIYDPAEGDPDGGIEPGTPFEDIPDDWMCPMCGVSKEDFSVYED